MRTTRANNYYRAGHGRCAFPAGCRCQVNFEGETYCTDVNGERKDYCQHFIQPGDISSICWIIQTGEDWKHLKAKVKAEKGASFVMPIELAGIPVKYKLSAFNLGFMNRTKGVMYTTDKRIEERYGLTQRFYAFTFLKDVFEEELERMQS